MEAHMLALRPPRGAGRPAIDAGGLHRIVEDVVGRAVAPLHGLPALIVGREGRFVSPGRHGQGHDTLLLGIVLDPKIASAAPQALRALRSNPERSGNASG